MSGTVGTILAQTTAPYSYSRPFVQPAPVWDYWFALLFPLLIAICVVYKGIKVNHVRTLPREAGVMFLWIVLGLAGAALGLFVFVRIVG